MGGIERIIYDWWDGDILDEFKFGLVFVLLGYNNGVNMIFGKGVMKNYDS